MKLSLTFIARLVLIVSIGFFTTVGCNTVLDGYRQQELITVECKKGDL